MTPKNQQLFILHAKKYAPKEACAFLVGTGEDETLLLGDNVHQEPTKHFLISPESYAQLEGRNITGVVHSHLGTSALPSDADKVMCEETAVPWSIYALGSDSWHSFVPTGFKLPLVGRQFVYGVVDCYTLVRDYYREKCGLYVADFFRSTDNWGTEEKYLDNFASQGFVRVSDLQEHDTLLIQLASDRVNHAAVYQGNGLILHHYYKHLSCIQPYGGYWLKNTRMIVRHFSLFSK
jgi:proteasome lid subunit RPN8/RPN11